jgi:transposase InsO family protein
MSVICVTAEAGSAKRQLTLRKGARSGKPDALLHHSDRGSQYTSEQWITSRLFRNVHHRGFWPQQLAVVWDQHLIADLAE